MKAELAQFLIARSWQQARTGQAPPPWPWADTRPAAVLKVPSLQVRQYVLKGNSGRNLAFGPVFTDGTETGLDHILNGHRDTHFRFLANLQEGDRIGLETPERTKWYEVKRLEVVDSSRMEMMVEPGVERLSLVTCYPFDSLEAGGPLRYVVTALPISM
jgi:sortase A